MLQIGPMYRQTSWDDHVVPHGFRESIEHLRYIVGDLRTNTVTLEGIDYTCLYKI